MDSKNIIVSLYIDLVLIQMYMYMEYNKSVGRIVNNVLDQR